VTGKLTTIVAIDVVGYSALAQADEEAALAAVAQLMERAAASAAAHGGRIFSTAGDAVMMEFNSVGEGLRAASELAADPDPPIRVGLHLGEVSELPSGDLLGHGVNVASRLQSQAHAGAVLVSEDARRALRGPLAKRLVSRGVIKLNKIDERIGVYELTAEENPDQHPVDGPQRDVRRMKFAAIGAIALAAVVVLAVLVWPLFSGPPQTRVAVFSPSAQTDGALEALTAGVADDITLALTAMGVEAIARAETAQGSREERLDRAGALGAALAIEGAAETNGDQVRLTINIVRTRDRTTLWSHAFDGPADALDGLRQAAAERSADVLACGVRVVRMRREDLAGDVFTQLLRGCEAMREADGMLEARDAFAQVVGREPDFAYANALLALAGAMASEGSPETVREQLRDSARGEAERALRADRNIGESYIALSLLEPANNWDAREDLLRSGLERDELNGTLNNFYSNLLEELGRSEEALAFAQRGATLDPLSMSKRRNVANLLMVTGDFDQARDIVEAMAAAYPNDVRHWWARMRIALWSGAAADASALLSAPASPVRSSRARDCWRQAAEAIRRPTPTARDLVNVQTCTRSGDLPAPQAIMMLSALGDQDGAFALARTTFVDDDRGGHAVLFAPATAPMRNEPRFMALMNDLGLVQHWHLSNRWPDFCDDRGLPYRCQDEASRLL